MKNLIFTLVLALASFQLFAQCNLTVDSYVLQNVNASTGEYDLYICYSWANAEPTVGNGAENIYFNVYDASGNGNGFLIIDNNVPFGSSGTNCGAVSVTGSAGNYTFTSPVAPLSLFDSFTETFGGATESGVSFNLDFNGTCKTSNIVYTTGVSSTCDDGIMNGDEIGIDCGGLNCLVCPTCDDGIMNGDETEIDCGGTNCNACIVCDENTIYVNLDFDDFAGETSWSITDSNDVVVVSGLNNYLNGTTFVSNEAACLENGCYNFNINDSFGDGMCCSYGPGSYLVTDVNGNEIASGGAFAAQEVTPFCVDGVTCEDGIMNGNEEGIDCGGTNCLPCETCGMATGLAETNLTATSVTLVWDAQADAEGYRVGGRRVNGPNKAFETTDNTMDFYLLPNTDYEWTVKVLCDGVWTDYTEIQAFTTLAATGKNVPLFDIFDDVENTLASNIYPNPATNEVNVTFMSSAQSEVQVNILDVTGRILMTQNVQSDTWETEVRLDISDLQNGYYLVEVNDGVVSTTSKLNVIR